MNRKTKLLLNFLIIFAISLVIYASQSYYMSPMAAHQAAERNAHFGPSEIIHMEDFSGGKFFVGKYHHWLSFSTIEKTMGRFWRVRSLTLGIKLDNDKPLFYTWSYSQPYTSAFGIVHDPNIDKVEIQLTDGAILTQSEFQEDMFFLNWEREAEFWKITAYDSSGTIIFQDQRTR